MSEFKLKYRLATTGEVFNFAKLVNPTRYFREDGIMVTESSMETDYSDFKKKKIIKKRNTEWVTTENGFRVQRKVGLRD